MAPEPPRCNIFGPTPAYSPPMPLVLKMSTGVAKNGPGFNGASADGLGAAASKVLASASFCTTERHTSVQQLRAVPVAPAAKPEITSWPSLLETTHDTCDLYQSRERKKPPVHRN